MDPINKQSLWFSRRPSKREKRTSATHSSTNKNQAPVRIGRGLELGEFTSIQQPAPESSEQPGPTWRSEGQWQDSCAQTSPGFALLVRSIPSDDWRQALHRCHRENTHRIECSLSSMDLPEIS